ncbi:MAG TPA: flagellar basal-body MS-ring/collar protein FliF [Nevskia sp.]|nr:flagellar basal-body MS-ring/collar protein FliF [Nevskia sp.]
MNAAVRESALSWWTGFDRNRRLGLLAGLVALALAIGLFAWFSLRSDYVALTGELSKEDTAAVVAQLEDIRARYRVDADTGALMVPAAEVDSIRAQLAQKGWPLKAAAGFELFDGGDFGMTEFTEHINYQRALEGELARTIMSLDSVRYARVHLVLPQSSLFKKNAEAPKASVLLVGRHGQPITEAQISGIQRMVASAVPELKAENVSIHDHKGVELTSGTGEGLSPAAVDAGLRAQADVEDYLTAKAEEILARMFPKGAATVSVTAALGRSHVSSVRDEVLPSGQGSGAVSHIRSDTLPDGVAANVPRSIKDGVAAKADNSSPQFDVEYRIGHVSEQSESPPGGIERLSVGVVIPDPAPLGLTVEGVRDLVAAGMGIDAQRGDRVAVYAISGGSKAAQATGSVEMPAATAGSPAKPQHERPYWAFLLGVALLLAACAVALARRPKQRQLSAAEREELLRHVREWLKQ